MLPISIIANSCTDTMVLKYLDITDGSGDPWREDNSVFIGASPCDVIGPRLQSVGTATSCSQGNRVAYN